MKLVDNKNTTWRKISKVILIVNSVEISYRNSFSIDLNCNFENCSPGSPCDCIDSSLVNASTKSQLNWKEKPFTYN